MQPTTVPPPQLQDTIPPGRAALELLEWGLAVFPVYEARPDGACTCGSPRCGQAGKHPRVTAGFTAASRDAARVRASWQTWPQANLGVPTRTPASSPSTRTSATAGAPA